MIIDTETHVLILSWPNVINPEQSLVKHHTWHEHSGDLLVAEMDNAGVDKTILISYDIHDVIWAWERKGFTIDDMAGGKKYAVRAVRQHPDRFVWFSTVKPPKYGPHLDIVRQDIAEGVHGLKIFPAHMERMLDHPDMLAVFDLCAEHGLPAHISFENALLADSAPFNDLNVYFEQMAMVLERYPTVKFALLHAGCADPLTLASDEMTDVLQRQAVQRGSTFPTVSSDVSIQPVIDMVHRFPNLYLSTAAPGNIWDDGSEYPFPNYLARLRILNEAVGADRLMWATDWPWLEHMFKYEQAVNAIRRHATFMNEDQKNAFLGDTAVRFLYGER